MKVLGYSFRCTLLSFLVLFLFASCSDDKYINAIPEDCIAIVAVDMQETIGASEGNTASIAALQKLFDIDDLANCGIDYTSKLYLFETSDGNIGMAVKVDDKGNLDDWLNRLSGKGGCKKTEKLDGYSFTVIKDSWVAGFSSDALVVIGPVLPAQHSEVQRRVVRFLEQDEEHSIKVSPMFSRVDSLDSRIAVVARASALPEKLVAPFMIGAPKGADASQILVSAKIDNNKDGCLLVGGGTFSYNKDIDSQLKASMKVFRPLTGRYFKSMPSDALLGAFMNVDGKQFITLLHSNDVFQALLAGMNAAIDMDNIIKSVDGEMAIVASSLSGNDKSLSLCAQLDSKDFLKDVSYWKQSCPAGSKITDIGKDTYCFTNGQVNYYFGVSGDMQFFSGTTEDKARRSISGVQNPLPAAVVGNVKGSRLCMVLNVDSLAGVNNNAGFVSGLVNSLFGDVKYILYSME